MDGYSFVRCHGTELRSRRDNDNDDQTRERGTWNLNTRLQVISEWLCPPPHWSPSLANCVPTTNHYNSDDDGDDALCPEHGIVVQETNRRDNFQSIAAN